MGWGMLWVVLLSLVNSFVGVRCGGNLCVNKTTENMTQEIPILVHNIAGELASLYINYLARMGGRLSEEYFLKNWKSEYYSRVKIMTDNPEMIERLNGYNDFYKCRIDQTGETRRTFCYGNF